MKYKFKITGIDCPVCASKLCTMIAELDGVDNVKINFLTERLTIETSADIDAIMVEVIKVAKSFSEDIEITK